MKTTHFGANTRKGTEMKSRRILELALITFLGMLATTTTPAFAATSQWLVGGSTVSSPVKVDSVEEGEFTFEEMNIGAKISCSEVSDKGTVGPGAADTEESVEYKKCKAVTGCENVEEVAAANLPRKTEVILLSGRFFDKIKAFAWRMVCKILGIKVSSVCSKEEMTVELVNTATEVVSHFNTEEEASCSTSGKNSGLAHGLERLLTVSGAALALSEA
jgi:hypothetical protein